MRPAALAFAIAVSIVLSSSASSEQLDNIGRVDKSCGLDIHNIEPEAMAEGASQERELVTVLSSPCLLAGDCTAEEHLAQEPVEALAKAVQGQRVIIFSKSYCPYCKRTKELLQENSIPYEYVELDELGERGPIVQQALAEYTGQRTVPNVFVGGKSIGGATDTAQKWKDGRLAKLLEELNIPFSRQ